MKNYNYLSLIEKIILILIVLLAIIFFYYPIQKPIPVGTDAVIYLNDVKYIVNNGNIPNPYQATYHGFLAYTAPSTDIILTLLFHITNINLLYPLFSLYQIFLIILLILTSYLVGRLYNRIISLIFPLLLLGSFSIIRLFMGSTLSNLLAFVYINVIFFLVYKFIKFKKLKTFFVFILLLLAIFAAHNYLTAPIFIPIFVIYFIFISLVDCELKQYFSKLISKIKTCWKIIILVLASLLFFLLMAFYKNIIVETITSFWKTNIDDKFRFAINISEYGNYMGKQLFALAIIGFGLYFLKFKKNILSFKLLPALWLLVIFLIMQTHYFGIDFYYERIIFLGGIFICLFVSYFLSFMNNILNKKTFLILLVFSMVVILSSGEIRIKNLYDESNLVTKSQIEALKLINDRSNVDDVILSNVNGVSRTAHDIMITDRSFIYLSTINNCPENDQKCYAFNNPQLDTSIQYFKNSNVRYFLLMKPSAEGNEILNFLIQRYRNHNFSIIFERDDVWLFSLN